MAGQGGRRELASWGMQHGLTGYELVDVVRAIAAGRTDEEIADSVRAGHVAALRVEDARELVARVRGLWGLDRAAVDAWVQEVGR